MVDFTVNYKWEESRNWEGEACFGGLKDQYDLREWGFSEDEEVVSVEYHPPDPIKQSYFKWLKANPIFGPLIIGYSSELHTFEVDANYPADRFMATLSMLRLLAGDERVDYLGVIDDLYLLTGDLGLAIYMADMAEGYEAYSPMFKYREESIVPDWNIKDFVDFLNKKDSESQKNIGIEDHYSSRMTYDSVKTAITGRVIGEYTKREVSRLEVLDLMVYEGYTKVKQEIY